MSVVPATGFAEHSLAGQIVDAVRSVVGDMVVGLHEPRFEGNEWVYLKDCLDSGYVSSVGAYVDRFEAELAAYIGVRHAVAVVNGTAALHVALRLVGVGEGDEVLLPSLTFVATANAVRYCGAVPHFVDSEARTLGVDAAALREYLEVAAERRGEVWVNRASGRVIRALVVVHVFGHPAEIEALEVLARDFNLALVEDAAESLGSLYRGRHTGTWGVVGALSFNGNKTITSGGGGALFTDDAELARRAKHLTTTAKLPHRWAYRHDEVGYNYRLPNINAALGCAQLEQLEDFVAAQRRLGEAYLQAFRAIDGVEVVREPAECRSNYWLQTLLLDEARESQLEDILAATNDAGLATRPTWTPLHLLEPYRHAPRMDLAGTESLARRLLNLPSSAALVRESVTS